MKNKIPIQNLVRSNFLMAVVFGGLIGIFLFTYADSVTEAAFTVVQSIANILIVSFLNILVIIKIEQIGSHLSDKNKRLWRYVIAYLFTVAYSCCIAPIRGVFAEEDWKVVTFQQRLITILAGSLMINILIFIMHNLVMGHQLRNSIELENSELKAANAEANNLLLKQQIHPHFLFNALNILKTLYKKDVSAGDEYIVHLANFLRAAVSNTSEKVVKLSDEIKICADYIAMQKIRFGDALVCYIDTSLTENRDDLMPSFSLQPLLENAIKHNDATTQQPLIINMFRKDGYVVVENNLQPKKQPVPSTGSGLVNLVKRYQLISGDEVVINEGEAFFSVKLKILSA